jgi:glycosyltransferase involved in cell wall biosynthesis
MRIAYLGTKGLPSKSGTERVVEAIVKRLSGKHDITVYCDWKYTPAGTKIPGIRLIRIPTIQGKYTRSPLLFLLSAFHAMFFGEYDLIHVHGIDACFTLPILRLKYKIFSTSHQSATLGHRDKWGKIAQFLLEMTEYPFCYLSNYATSVSLIDVEFYEARYKTKVVYLPNGVDEEMVSNVNAACVELAGHGVQPNHFVLFAAGRIDPTKGCHLAIDAYNRIDPDIPLLVVGDLEQVPSYADNLRRMASNRRIIFIPLITDKELLYGIIKLARLLIFPSVNEGMSIMLLEAASLETPVICSDIDENRVVMKDFTLYFKTGDASSLADHLSWALAHPEQMRNLAKRAKEAVAKRLFWGNIVSCYESLYESCVRGEPLPDVNEQW